MMDKTKLKKIVAKKIEKIKEKEDARNLFEDCLTTKTCPECGDRLKQKAGSFIESMIGRHGETLVVFDCISCNFNKKAMIGRSD